MKPPEGESFLSQLLDLLNEVSLAVLLAVFGGAVRVSEGMVNREEGEKKITWGWIVAGIVTAGFVGLIMDRILASYPVPRNIHTAIVAVSGYSSNDVLAALRSRLLRKIAGTPSNINWEKCQSECEDDDDEEKGERS